MLQAVDEARNHGQTGHRPGGFEMTEKNPYRFGPTRGELWGWLAISAGGLGLLGGALAFRGLPTGPALVEVVGIAGLLFGYLGARSIKRLIRQEHP
jgi:hypothetical protein